MGQAAAGTSGDLSPWQAVGISGTALMQDLDLYSQPNHATGGFTHRPEFCSKLPLFLLVGGAATFCVSWLWFVVAAVRADKEGQGGTLLLCIGTYFSLLKIAPILKQLNCPCALI